MQLHKLYVCALNIIFALPGSIRLNDLQIKSSSTAGTCSRRQLKLESESNKIQVLFILSTNRGGVQLKTHLLCKLQNVLFLRYCQKMLAVPRFILSEIQYHKKMEKELFILY